MTTQTLTTAIALRVATDLRHVQVDAPYNQPQDVILDNEIERASCRERV